MPDNVYFEECSNTNTSLSSFLDSTIPTTLLLTQSDNSIVGDSSGEKNPWVDYEKDENDIINETFILNSTTCSLHEPAVMFFPEVNNTIKN